MCISVIDTHSGKQATQHLITLFMTLVYPIVTAMHDIHNYYAESKVCFDVHHSKVPKLQLINECMYLTCAYGI